MAVKDIYNLPQPNPSSPRNAFGIGYSNLFSSPCGLLMPAYIEDVKAKDKVSLSLFNITRTRPVNTSAFMAFDEKVDFWFVPYECIWSSYNDWRLGQTYNNSSASLIDAGSQQLLPSTSWTSLQPFFASLPVLPPDGSQQLKWMLPNAADTLRYLDLFNYGAPAINDYTVNIKNNTNSDSEDWNNITSYYSYFHNAGLRFNYFRLAAFQCIYMHCYRNQEYEEFDPSYFNVDNLFDNLVPFNNSTLAATAVSTNLQLAAGTDTSTAPVTGLSRRMTLAKLFTPRYKNWRDDLFTTLKPVSGFESGVSGLDFGSLSTSTAVPQGQAGSAFQWPQFDVDINQVESGKTFSDLNISSPLIPANQTSGQPNKDYGNYTYQYVNDNPAVVRQALYTKMVEGSDPLYGLAYLYPQNIRNLLAQDAYARSAIYADKNYQSQMKALFGIDVNDYHRPQYLGSYSNLISISDVVATSAGTDGDTDASTSILGEIAGKGYAQDSKEDVFSRTFDHDGIIIGVHYVMPRNNYDSYRANKFNTRVSRWDFYSPHFDGLGLQPVFAYERGASSATSFNPTSVLGYAPRYYEYKQRTNEVHGSFMVGQADYDWTLSNNAEPVSIASSMRNFKILPTITDRIFAVAYDGSVATDPFQHYYEFKVTRVSDLERYGVPSVN